MYLIGYLFQRTVDLSLHLDLDFSAFPALFYAFYLLLKNSVHKIYFW